MQRGRVGVSRVYLSQGATLSHFEVFISSLFDTENECIANVLAYYGITLLNRIVYW